MASPLDVARQWIEAMNAHDTPAMEALYAKSVRGLEIADPPEHDWDGLVDSYKELFSAFPDCKGEILNAFEGTEQALVELRWTGTNTGPFRGEAPTNEPSDLRIAYIFRVEKGKITRITEYYDSAQI